VEAKSEVSDVSQLLLVAFLLVNAPNCHLSFVLASVVLGDAVNYNASNLLSFIAMEPHCFQHAVPWSLDTCSTERSPVHGVQMHGVPNRHEFAPPHNSSVHLAATYVQRTMRTTLQESAFSSQRPAPTQTLEWLSQEEPGSGLNASTLVSGAYAPACTNGVWPVSAAQKNKPSTMLSSNVQSIVGW